MRNVLWFLLGVIGGFIAAHLMNKDPRGHEVLADVDARITEFTDRIGDAYREQEARISGVLDGVTDAAGDAAGTLKAAGAEAAGAAAQTASDAVEAAADAASGTVEAGRTAAKKITD